MAGVQVFGCPTWPEVARVLACLFEKEVKFQLIRPNNCEGLKQMPGDKLMGRPFKFTDGKESLQDSREICRHIAGRYPGGNKDLLGTNSLERDSIEQWLEKEVGSFDTPSTNLVRNLGGALPLPLDEKEIENSKQELNKVLESYEKRLQETEFLAGDKFTLADLFHLPNTEVLVSNEEYAWLITSRNAVRRWWDGISCRESWRLVVAMQQEISR